MAKLMIGLCIGLMLSASIAAGQDEPPRAPVQVEWWVDEYNVVWYDCWPSDGTIEGRIMVFVMGDPLGIYACRMGTRYHIHPIPSEKNRDIEHIQVVP
jgi:hypothetical protein